MSILGSAGDWHDLLDSLVPEIVDLILEAWKSMPPVDADAKEDPISEELCKRLRATRELSRLPLQVHTQSVELESAAAIDQGRIDIAFFLLVPSERFYFALECKRINALQKNGDIRRYYAEYVDEGLMRFVTGQYSQSVRHGGMFAFVLDGDIDAAVNGVGTNITKKRDATRMVGKELEYSRYRKSNDLIFESEHERSVEAGTVLIQHFFMSAKLLGDGNDQRVWATV